MAATTSQRERPRNFSAPKSIVVRMTMTRPRLVLLVIFGAASVALAAPAEWVVRRAKVITMDTNQPRAQAFAVSDGKFVAVGSDESMRPFIGANTRVLELAGK